MPTARFRYGEGTARRQASPSPAQQERDTPVVPRRLTRQERGTPAVSRLAQQEGRTQAALIWFLRLFWDEPSLTRDALALPRNRTPSVSA